MSRAVFAFSRDLRLADHAGLAAAGRHGEVVPVLVIDPVSAARLRRSPRRAAYYCAAVRALDAQLRERGSALIVRRGNPGQALRALARAVGAGVVGWSCGYDAKSIRRDRDTQSTLEEAGLRALPIHDAPAVPPEDAAASHSRGEGYRAFVPYYARWRTLIPVDDAGSATFAAHELASEPLPIPEEFGSQATLGEAVGEAPSLARMAAFLSAAVLQYGTARNVPAAGETSHLSSALSFGTIAARSVVRATCRRAGDPFLLVEERTSLKLFLRALAQRDFFLQLAWYNESLAEEPLQAKMRGFTFARTHPHLDAWRSGRTGYPLIDAGIRELRATGWMHPRVRAIAASFLCFDLGVDWRVGRDEWDHYLTEDDPALAAGTGSGSRASAPTSRRTRASTTRSSRRGGSIRRVTTCGNGSPSSPDCPMPRCSSPKRRAKSASCDCRSSGAKRIPLRSSITSWSLARSSNATHARSVPRPNAGHSRVPGQLLTKTSV